MVVQVELTIELEVLGDAEVGCVEVPAELAVPGFDGAFDCKASGGGASLTGGDVQSPRETPKSRIHGKWNSGKLGNEKSTLGIGGRFHNSTPRPPPIKMNGIRVV